jgi:hypothetical protein
MYSDFAKREKTPQDILLEEALKNAQDIPQAHEEWWDAAKPEEISAYYESMVTGDFWKNATIPQLAVLIHNCAGRDSQDKNGNGFKGYELEKGEYTFYAGTDAHNSFGEFKKTLAADVQIDKDPVTGYKVEPLFPELTAHMNPAESLSRNNFAGTFPKVITDDERALDEDTFAKLKSQESTNDETYDKVPTMGAEVKYTLRDMAGKKYDDPMWEEFLDQFTFEEMLMLFNDGCYSTASITRKMKVINEETHEEEGPAHDRTYTAIVKIDDIKYGEGTAHSKKDAEQMAAKDALNKSVK